MDAETPTPEEIDEIETIDSLQTEISELKKQLYEQSKRIARIIAMNKHYLKETRAKYQLRINALNVKLKKNKKPILRRYTPEQIQTVRDLFSKLGDDITVADVRDVLGLSGSKLVYLIRKIKQEQRQKNEEST
jgi:FtsZ-binding cell division protein ZapB